MAWENKKSSRTFKLARLKVENTKQSKQLLNSDLVGGCRVQQGSPPPSTVYETNGSSQHSLCKGYTPYFDGMRNEDDNV